MESKATCKIVIENRNTLGEFKPVKIKVYFQSKSKYFATDTKIKLSVAEFKNDRLKKTKQAIEESQRALQIAEKICSDMGLDFSFYKFSKRFHVEMYGEEKNMTIFSSIITEYISTLDNFKTIESYKIALGWVNSFNPKIKISDIDTDVVKELILHIKEKHKSKFGKEMSENTIRIYLRNLRAVFNYARQKQYTTSENPFSSIKGQSLSSIDRQFGALSEAELATFAKYHGNSKIETMAKDFFFLTMMLCGANLGDILSLKNGDIDDNGYVSFVRRKTKKSGVIINFELIDDAKNILNTYGSIRPLQPHEFILPYLANCKNEKAIRNKIHDIGKKINRGLRTICENLGICKITLYNARHTYALLASDTLNLSAIQKYMGHTSSNTTTHYLNRISTQTQRQNTAVLNKIGNSLSQN